MFYVYMLKSNSHDELYVGSTNDLRKRVLEHNNGKVYSTRNKKPYMLIYYEAYRVEADARRREKMLKLRGQARHQLITRLKDSLGKNKN